MLNPLEGAHAICRGRLWDVVSMTPSATGPGWTFTLTTFDRSIRCEVTTVILPWDDGAEIELLERTYDNDGD